MTKVTSREPAHSLTEHISVAREPEPHTELVVSSLRDLSLSFLPEFLMLYLPGLHPALASLFAGRDCRPDGGWLAVSVPAKLQRHPGLPEPGEHLPPKPRARALPCRTACSLIYEGQAGTGPSGRQGR